MDNNTEKKRKKLSLKKSVDDGTGTKVVNADENDDKYKDIIEEARENIKRVMASNRDNINRFKEFQRFVYYSTLNEDEVTALDGLQRPALQFNMLKPMANRLIGEFSKQQPCIYVEADEFEEVDPKTLEVLQGRLADIMHELQNRDNQQTAIYRDQITGGYSSAKVRTSYKSSKAFAQDIIIEKTYNPCFVGFDDSATRTDKADAEFCFEFFPMSLNSFKAKYPEIDTSDLSFRSIVNDDFQFTYSQDSRKIVIVVDYYKIMHDRETLYLLSDGKTMLKDEYDEKKWPKFQQKPKILDERNTEIKRCCRCRFVDKQVIEVQDDTLTSCVPIVNFDGDSVRIEKDGYFKDFTSPYMLQAEGIQKLMNAAGQTLANDIENVTQQKLLIAQEALPDDKDQYMDSLLNFQSSTLAVYKSRDEENPNFQIPPPREIQRVGLPQDVLMAFNNSAQILQYITGSYDAQLGIQNKDLSGTAIVEGATQSNATAMPYVINHMTALTQIAKLIVEIIPKIYTTPRTIPVRDKSGKRTFVRINDPNDPNSVNFSYNHEHINVRVEAGVNFEIEKNRAIQQIVGIMKVSPQFNAFMSQQGLPILFDNLSFRGSNIVKEMAEDWLKQQEEAQKQQGKQPNPELMDSESKMISAIAKLIEAKDNSAKLQSEIQKDTYDTIIDAKNTEIAQEKADTDRIKALTEVGESKASVGMEQQKLDAESKRTNQEMIMALINSLQEQDRLQLEKVNAVSNFINPQY